MDDIDRELEEKLKFDHMYFAADANNNIENEASIDGELGKRVRSNVFCYG